MTALGDRFGGGQLPEFATTQTVDLSTTAVIQVLLLVYACSVALMGLTRVLPAVFAAPPIVLSLTFVPGALLLVTLARGSVTVGVAHVLYAFGTSLVLLMVVGVVVNILLPLAGVANPLLALPLGLGVTVTVGVLSGIAWWRNPSGTVSVRVPPLWSPPMFGLLLLPLLSVLGVHLLNTTGRNYLLLPVLFGIAVLPLLAIGRLQERWYPLAIWTMSLAILYHKSLWQYAGFGGRPHGITAWEAGRWSPGVVSIDPYSSELLQNGVLFPLFARLSDVFIMTQYEVVNPFFVSFIPLALYVAFRQYASSDVALLGAAVFAFAHPFYYQYPTAGRAATPVIFLALFGVALSNRGLSPVSRTLLSVTFLLGVVVTHYASSYYVAAAFVLAVLLLYGLRVADLVAGYLRRATPVSDGGTATSGRPSSISRATIFSLSTVLFFVSAAIGWYLYTRQGWKFELLPRHIYDNLVAFIRSSPGGGRTAARVQESYSASSIQLSKYVYILLAGLILLGILVVYYRRLVATESSFDDHYLAIATGMFAVFGATLVFSNWGGGRPLMITFSFTTVFAVLGTMWLADGFRRLLRRLVQYVPRLATVTERVDRTSVADLSPGAAPFALLLLAFFVLNSGVAAATLFEGGAPSNVPAQANLESSDAPRSQVTVHRGTDIVTHVWLVQHLDRTHTVYADTYGARQYDWYRPDVAARTPAIGGGYTVATKPEVMNTDGLRAGTERGYLLIAGHNMALDAAWEGKFREPVPLETLGLDRRNRIYTTGESRIYLTANRTASREATSADEST